MKHLKPWILLPPCPDACQECAVKHPPEIPHNQQSLFYQYHFYAEHGRWPTWDDAMAHCSPEIQTLWKAELKKVMNEREQN
jgi:hypothetical protein